MKFKIYKLVNEIKYFISFEFYYLMYYLFFGFFHFITLYFFKYTYKINMYSNSLYLLLYINTSIKYSTLFSVTFFDLFLFLLCLILQDYIFIQFKYFGIETSRDMHIVQLQWRIRSNSSIIRLFRAFIRILSWWRLHFRCLFLWRGLPNVIEFERCTVICWFQISLSRLLCSRFVWNRW